MIQKCSRWERCWKSSRHSGYSAFVEINDRQVYKQSAISLYVGAESNTASTGRFPQGKRFTLALSLNGAGSGVCSGHLLQAGDPFAAFVRSAFSGGNKSATGVYGQVTFGARVQGTLVRFSRVGTPSLAEEEESEWEWDRT